MLSQVAGVSLILNLVVYVQCSPCTDYKTLGNSTKRLLSYVVSPSTDHSELLCDGDADGWYRMGEGHVASTCAMQYSCGTQAPIRLNDSVPAVHQQENKTFCVDHAGANQLNKCCTFTHTMPVMNCGEFLVVRLTSGMIMCPSAICIDPDDHDPVVSLTGPYLDNGDFSFHCGFKYDIRAPRETADITWLFDGVPVIPTKTYSYPNQVAYLKSDAWIGHLGSSLSCKLTTNNVNYESDAYWGGIKIEASPERITEGEETTLTIQSTLPITCVAGVSDEDCHLDLALVVDGEHSYSGIFGVDDCNATLHRLYWNNKTLLVETTLTIVPSIDPVVKPNTSRTLTVEAVKGQNLPDLWKTPHSNTTILQNDVEHKNCFLFGQNHIRGTNSQLFSLDLTGYFLMFKINSPDIDFQIQTLHMMVGDSFPSTCAVAVEYSGQVITVDMCRAHTDDNTETIITQRGDLNSGMYISQCGMADLELSTDADIRVEVKVQKHNLDINVHLPPSLEPEQQDGFCANSTSFRLGSTTNLFKTADSSNWRSVKDSTKYCDCISGSSTCKTSLSRNITEPSVDPIENMNYFCNKIQLHKDVPRSKAVIHDFKPPGHTWPKSGTNQSEAINKCEDVLRSLVPAYCRTSVAGVQPDYTSFRSTCLADIKNSGTVDYMKSSLQGFLWECQINLLKNPDNYMRSHDQYIPPAEVTSNLCPDFCNMHGDCTRGSCHCEQGFMGEDCGVPVGAVPTIEDILGGISCKSHAQNCTRPVLFIKNALRNVTVKILPIKIEGGKTVVMDNEEVVMKITMTSRHGSSIDIAPIMANFNDPTAYAVNFTLSNDGVKFGNRFTYYVFDEICHKCLMENRHWTCFEMETGCRISGECFEQGTPNPQNTSETCDTDCALREWSPVGHVC